MAGAARTDGHAADETPTISLTSRGGLVAVFHLADVVTGEERGYTVRIHARDSRASLLTALANALG